MLTSVEIENFKSYEAATLHLAPLTVLIGANASGKSNALEALRLLSWIAQGNRLSNIKYAVYENDAAVRGTTKDLGFRGEQKFTIKATLNNRWEYVSFTLLVDGNGDLHISDESMDVLNFSSLPLYQVVGRTGGVGSDLQVAYNNFARGGVKPKVSCTDQMAIMTQLQSSARFGSGHKQAQRLIPDSCERFQRELSAFLFLDPQPSVMRGYSFKTDDRLHGDGSNLSGVLARLCEDVATSHRLLNLIRSLPEQNINAVDFITTPKGEVMVKLEETFGGVNRWVDATLLSDGTLRVLSIAAAIMSARQGSLVVIEEIDNGVHPSRAGMLLGSISSIAKERKIRVLISSHNPALLDALPDDAVPDVVFCYRSPKGGESDLVRLRDIPDYPALIAQGSVGHLMTNGLLERFVKTHPGPDKKREQARAWLDELRAL
ncbi:AAA family ATPase [uncultured Brevundimonas sp.]|uniref:AAA family ATPase n=1 Tax=uncultured Brevundimonas sp. TaxID=213418 RepID=UPI0025E39590|nr:ATP-binding protein [uncultured Brevundimonas sp.]